MIPIEEAFYDKKKFSLPVSLESYGDVNKECRRYEQEK